VSASGVTIEEWLQASVEALRELATTALGLEGLEVGEVRESMPANVGGAFIPLSAEGDSAQVGLAGGPDQRKLVSGALMQMSPDEAADLTNSDVADAMGEIVNIAAGGIKQRLQPKLGKLTLGLPLFINGQVEATEKVVTRVADLTMGNISLVLVIVRAREVR
jgi:hypothetical protein